MLKQWFLGRKKSSSTKMLTGHLQDPNIICSLGDRYVVYRTNPIYVDDNHLLEAVGKPSKLSVLAPHDPKLHVQTWCSLVCPKHLTTCCTCKPAWIYCDNCHPPPVKHHSVTVPSSPDLLPSHHLKENVATPLTYVQNRFPDLTLSPGDLLVSDQEMNGSHYYHVIDPFDASDEVQKFSTNAASTAIHSKEDVSQSHRYNYHHHHHNNNKNSKSHRPNSNNKSHHQRHHHHHHPHHHHHHHYHQSNEHQKRKFNNNSNADKDNNLSGSNNTAKKSSPLLHIYINSDFVSGIAVSGSNAVVNGDQSSSSSSTSLNQTDSENYVYPEMNSNNTVADGQLDVSAETDSLESLRIDERIFAPAIEHSHSHGVQDVSDEIAVHFESDDQDQDDFIFPNGRSIHKLETVSPTSSKILLTDSEAAYEAVKDLYEKLSNNRHRQVVTQAMSDTQKSKAIRSYVQNTYETLTKHTRLSYAKLVSDDSRRTSSIYLVPSETIASLNNALTFNPNHHEDKHSLKEQGQGDNGSVSNERTEPNVDSINDSNSDENNSGETTTIPDVTRKDSVNDQFITRRDPKYGDQVIIVSLSNTF